MADIDKLQQFIDIRIVVDTVCPELDEEDSQFIAYYIWSNLTALELLDFLKKTLRRHLIEDKGYCHDLIDACMEKSSGMSREKFIELCKVLIHD